MILLVQGVWQPWMQNITCKILVSRMVRVFDVVAGVEKVKAFLSPV